jgi:hypothetical protein
MYLIIALVTGQNARAVSIGKDKIKWGKVKSSTHIQ